MKIFRIEDFVQMQNPTPKERYKKDLLTEGEKAKTLGGHFTTLCPGGNLSCHYHRKRESLIFVISGKIVETVEGEEHALKAGDVIFLAAGEKHEMSNRSDAEARYLEFFSPLGFDTVKVQ